MEWDSHCEFHAFKGWGFDICFWICILDLLSWRWQYKWTYYADIHLGFLQWNELRSTLICLAKTKCSSPIFLFSSVLSYGVKRQWTGQTKATKLTFVITIKQQWRNSRKLLAFKNSNLRLYSNILQYLSERNQEWNEGKIETNTHLALANHFNELCTSLYSKESKHALWKSAQYVHLYCHLQGSKSSIHIQMQISKP